MIEKAKQRKEKKPNLTVGVLVDFTKVSSRTLGSLVLLSSSKQSESSCDDGQDAMWRGACSM